jgi:acyl transferase domain-containing protein
MSELLKRIAALPAEQRAALAELLRPAPDPVAVIGIGCRFPGGANSPEAFWRLLHDGVDAIVEVPSERWNIGEVYDPNPDEPGKMYTRWGGFLREDVAGFDTGFFGISPREATFMDPQQRLLLEVAWEALENAGQPIEKLAGSPTGVFMGVCSNDYSLRQSFQLEQLDAYSGSGSAHSIVANRLSYLLDLRGPSLAIDTACSSSLVALHLACQSLQAKECSLALAGGVNLILSPDASVVFSKSHMLSPDGRCKTFDARADGYVRGEGCGVVVLKRLSEAQAASDPILAILRSSAINQDGKSAGLTAPNLQAQQAVIRKALAEAGLQPHHISYIEAHGTGTSLGDPIEVEALTSVIGAPTPEQPTCWLGSVKTNIGHLEAAAGVAGLIKVILSLQHQTIPPHLHFRQLNPAISLQGSRFVIPTTPIPWLSSPNAPRRAGISSFGFGGTNAHLIVEEAPAAPSQPTRETPQRAWLLPISARSPAALQALAGAYREYLSQENPPALPDLCATASLRRSHLPYRLAVTGQSHAQLAEQLTAWLQSGEPASPTPAVHLPGGVFVFSGQSGDTISLGRQLLDQEPAFAAALNECDRIIHSLTGWSPITELTASPPSARLVQTDVMQPTLFSLQVALAALWRSWGVEPTAIVGHSVGEIAAAYVAGALSLEQAAQVVVHRSRLMQRMAGLGRMAAIELSPQAAEQLLAEAGFSNRLSVAAINAPSSVVLSGEKEALATILERLADQPIFKRLLAVNYAFHSQQMAPLQDELTQALVGLTPAETAIPFFSTVTGQAISGRELDAAYWGRNLRQTVRFSQAMQNLIAAGHTAWIEIGPHPVLQAPMLQCLGGQPGLVVASLRQGKDAHLTLLEALGKLYRLGMDPCWAELVPAGQVVPLPNYPWQRQRYWLEPPTYNGEAQKRPMTITTADEPESLYAVTWKEQPPAGQTGAFAADLWLVWSNPHGDDAALAATLAGALAKNGQPCWQITPGAAYNRQENCVSLPPGDPAGWRKLFEAIEPGQRVGLIYLAGSDTPVGIDSSAEDWQAVVENLCGDVITLVQGLSQFTPPDRFRLWLVTRGAQVVDGAARTIHLAQAPLWGLGRVLVLEHPEWWGGLVDLDPQADCTTSSGHLLAELGSSGEDQVAWRGNSRRVARLESSPLATTGQPISVDPRGLYLITGGLGSLGLQMADWLVALGTRHLLLTSRSGLPERSSWESLPADSKAGRQVRAVLALEAQGVSVMVAQADVENWAVMQELFANLAHTGNPLRGVIHAAGVATLQAIVTMDKPSLSEVLRPKVMGAWNLHRLTQAMPLDFFVFFSSAAAIWGSQGVGHYAAANHFMDALAQWRRSAGLPGLSINWSWWASEGMVTPEMESFFTQSGLEAIPSALALGILEHLIAAQETQKTVARVRWDTFKAVYAARKPRPFLDFMVSTADAGGKETANLLEQWQQMPENQREAALEAHVRAVVQNVLGYGPDEFIPSQERFTESGMDSIMAVEVRTRLVSSLGQELPATLVFENPTIEKLTTYLARDVLKWEIPPISPPTADGMIPPASGNLDQLSHDELAALLDAELSTVGHLMNDQKGQSQ